MIRAIIIAAIGILILLTSCANKPWTCECMIAKSDRYGNTWVETENVRTYKSSLKRANKDCETFSSPTQTCGIR